ncbi:hypothetical protein D2A34_23200 [Clostridium chromiireducens]|uniref:Uncharacterized protein n=1 Tax=Clostridium chromiireducens TaxID=225345 RepID=A0A399INP1_9CLOT|nr:hypothetical protein [Clostridium chromiireducens]RII32576.1 hypothetical protein D2A34_23200 [Clostridium chromiireducens]
MAYMINDLYNLTLVLLRGCIVTVLVTGVYIIGIIKYTKKYRVPTVEAERIKINDISNKENI